MYKKLFCLFFVLGLLIILTRVPVEVRVFSESQARVNNAQESHKSAVQSKMNHSEDKHNLKSIEHIKKRVASDYLEVPSDEEMFCLLPKLMPSITLGGDVKIVAGNYIDDGAGQDSILTPKNVGVYAWVHSSECPKGKYSIVHFKENSKVEVALDCKSATMEDLIQNSSIQWSIEVTEPVDDEYNFAINGKGNFLVYCPDEGFHLTRRGRFHLNSSKMLVSDLGCMLWQSDRKSKKAHKPLLLKNGEQEFDDKGCVEGTNKCIAFLNYSNSGIRYLEYINRDYAFVEIDQALHSVLSSTNIYQDSLEDLDSPERGLTGIVDWNIQPKINSQIDCEK